jgi:hypothetical protein
MDDHFLHEMRREPRPEFARSLRERLRAAEEESAPRRAWFLHPAFAAAAAVAILVIAFSFPAVRVSAQALLDLFRVRNFAAVPFDASRMEKLHSLEQDNAMLIFDEQQVVKEPGEAQVVATPLSASAIAGIPVETPTYLPDGFQLEKVEVQGAGEVRLTLNVDKLRAVLDALDLQDVSVQRSMDGKTVTVRMTPIVTQTFRSGQRTLKLIQARSPEVELAPGVDLAAMGEIGLRILGLDAGEARRVASSIDWHSTLVVPVPANASQFREVTVKGNRGLLITTTTPVDGRRREGTVAMWSEGDRIFGLMGDRGGMDLMQIAESLQ